MRAFPCLTVSLSHPPLTATRTHRLIRPLPNPLLTIFASGVIQRVIRHRCRFLVAAKLWRQVRHFDCAQSLGIERLHLPPGRCLSFTHMLFWAPACPLPVLPISVSCHRGSLAPSLPAEFLAHALRRRAAAAVAPRWRRKSNLVNSTTEFTRGQVVSTARCGSNR